ncbi:MAG: hypothetical protein ACE5R4_10535 [Armatimonadota bacterium]
MPLEDKQLRLRVMREIARRNVDSSRLDVEAIGDVVYLRGRLRPLRSQRGKIDMQKELETIKDNIMRLRGVRDVSDRDLILLES